MTELPLTIDTGRVPAGCSLPTAEQPLRVAEFGELFSRDVVGLARPAGNVLSLGVRPDPEVAARAADLAVREAGCCSFFTFDLTISDGSVTLTVRIDESHTEVLAALEQRARALMAGSR